MADQENAASASARLIAAGMRRLRTERGMTLAEAGKLLQLSPSNVCRAENGRHAPVPVRRIASAFGVPASEVTAPCPHCRYDPPAGYRCLRCATTAGPHCSPAGEPFPGRPGYVTGECGHAVAGSEWRAGFRVCERCPPPEREDTSPAADLLTTIRSARAAVVQVLADGQDPGPAIVVLTDAWDKLDSHMTGGGEPPADWAEDLGETADCRSCGQLIAVNDDARWVHVKNPELTGAGDHAAER